MRFHRQRRFAQIAMSNLLTSAWARCSLSLKMWGKMALKIYVRFLPDSVSE